MKNSTILVFIIILLIIGGVVLWSSHNYPNRTVKTTAKEEVIPHTTLTPNQVVYPKDYPTELYFDLSPLTSTVTSKLSDGRTEIKSDFLSHNSLKDIGVAYKAMLVLGKWTVDENTSKDVITKITAKKDGAVVIVTFVSKTASTTEVTVQYQK